MSSTSPKDSGSESPEHTAEASEFTVTPHRTRIFTLIATSTFCASAGLSIISPFFPKEAATKGVSQGVLGWIYSIFEVSTMIFTPLTMSAIVAFGSKPLLVIGNIFGGLSNILLGLCWYAHRGTLFVTYCFVLRFTAGIGLALSSVTSYGLLPVLYGPSVSSASGILEGLNGIAMIIGPILGSALFSLGGGEEHLGYVLPFIVLGVVELVAAVVNLQLLPKLPKPPPQAPSMGNFSWKVLVPCINCVMSGTALGLLGPTLEPHLGGPPLRYSIPTVGILFSVACAVYAVLAPITGAVDDFTDGRYAIQLMAIGALTAGFGYAWLAPVPLVIGGSELILNTAAAWGGISLIGAGCGIGLIPVYKRTLLYAMHEDTTQRDIATSALFTLVFSFGSFLGPTLGGLLSQAFGVQTAYTIAGASMCALAIAFLILSVTPAFRATTTRVRTAPLLAAQESASQQGTTSLQASRAV